MDLKHMAAIVGSAFGICALACSGVQTADDIQLVAKGESFANLTEISGNVFPASRPTISASGSVVFESSKDGNWDLYLKQNPTAQALQKLTNHGAEDRDPAFAPDGNQIAFASNRSGNFDIFILRTDGGTAKRQVTDSNEDEFQPAFSPDGRVIAYTRYSRVDGQYYIWTKDLDTDANVQVGPGVNPRFSPDGSTILFQKPSQMGAKWYGIWTMDRNGARLTELMSSQDWGAIQASWSPDGKKILFATSKGVNSESWEIRTKTATGTETTDAVQPSGINLWVMNSDGSALTQLTTHPQNDTWPVWTADNFVYFTSMRDGKEKVWRFTPLLPDGYVPVAAVVEAPVATEAVVDEAPATEIPTN